MIDLWFLLSRFWVGINMKFMPFSPSPVRPNEPDSSTKLMNKMAIYYFNQKEGEVLECNALEKIVDQGFMTIDGTNFTLPGATHFSRDAVAINRTFNNIKSSSFQHQVPAVGMHAKVQNGANEIDIVLQAPNKTAFIECKSGNAASPPTQTSSYLQCCLEEILINQANGHMAYFVHLYEGTSAADSADYIFNCLIDIAINKQAILMTIPPWAHAPNTPLPPPNGVQFFLPMITANRMVQGVANRAAFIAHYNQLRLTNLPTTMDSHATSLATICRDALRLSFVSMAIQKLTGDNMKIKLRKKIMAKYQYDIAFRPKNIWYELANS